MFNTTKNFSSYNGPILEPKGLFEFQLNSFNWLKTQGWKELFEEFFPVKDPSGKELELHYLSYKFDAPKFSEEESKHREQSYVSSLKVKLKLVNHLTKKTVTQSVYFGDYPLMTDRGTFIINGVERVVVSQLIRSPGVYFTANVFKGKKLFGAKLIPSKGSWLEFETNPDSSIWVRIDKKRKIPVTDLLRAFGLETDKEILAALGEKIKPTLNRDAAKNKATAFVEIYRRLRPSDLATVENAKSLVESMFFSTERYDLFDVGRYKLNQRLGFKNKASRLLDLEDLTTIVREIINLNENPGAEPDDIDHLGNRRIRPVGELIQSKLRVGFGRLRRAIQDRMSTLEKTSLVPAQLINPKVLTSLVDGFFALCSLSQFMDQVNPLAELEHKRLLSVMGPGGLTRERAGFEVRDVQSSYYGRICPIQTPEGTNIGLVNKLASFARINKLGFLETPYFKVKDGKVTNQVVWLDAIEEEKHVIAMFGIPINQQNEIIPARVKARKGGRPGLFKKSEIEFIDVSCYQPFSLATSAIPFLEHDEANRALMGSNMQRQAVPLLTSQPPLVATGIETKIARDSRQVIISPEDGKILKADQQAIILKGKSGKIYEFKVDKFKLSNQYTCISQQIKVEPGQKVKKGQYLTDSYAIKDGCLSLGQNLLVAFIPYYGANFEDAVVISERLVRDDKFTSIHIEDFYCDVRDTNLGPEETTPDIPNVAEEKLANLDEEGIVRIGTEVFGGDILVGKISPKGERELTSEEKLLQAIFGKESIEVKNTSLTLPYGKRGKIVGVKVYSREKGDQLEPGVLKRIRVRLAQWRNIQAGDKLAGRHGNKGVVSQVRPIEDMPYLEDGTPVDIILNPLSIASRMNLGQVLETHLGWAAKKLNYQAITPIFVGAKSKNIKMELKKAGLPESGKVTLYDGRTGEPFEQKVTVGFIYMMKLNHLVEDKIHMRSTGPYSLITQQPLGGKARMGGQRFGEMEVWALEGYGAAHTLQEMLTIKSDDVPGRTAAFESIIKGEKIKKLLVPASFKVLVCELKSLVLNVDIEKKGDEIKSIKLTLASPEQILDWCYAEKTLFKTFGKRGGGEVIKPETINYRTQRPERDGLFSERIFGPTRDYQCYCGKYKGPRYKGVICERCGVEVTHSRVRRERMGYIKLATPVAHIWFFKNIPSRIGLILDIPSDKLEEVIYYASYLVTSVDESRRKQAIESLVKKKISEQEKAILIQQIKTLKVGTVLSEDRYIWLNKHFKQVFEAGQGAETIRKLLEKIDLKKLRKELLEELKATESKGRRKKLSRRYNLVGNMLKAGVRPEWMILTVLPVLPPDLRPMVALDGGRYASSDINDLYRRVITRNNRLKELIELKAPQAIIANEKRMLQEAVDALIDNSARTGSTYLSRQHRPLKSLADILKGKKGRFRQNLLGKRVDYSGRSVIVAGPDLKLRECGLPKKMALELCRPYVIHKIIERELAYNVKTANRLIEQETPEIWAILEEIIKSKFVLLNRAPTLHRLGIQAFCPRLIEDLSIQIPAMVCRAFNADFDGDQMAVHLPLSELAQKEAAEIMFSAKNLLKPANGRPIVDPSQDMVLGCYYLTKEGSGKTKVFSGIKELKLAFEQGQITLHSPIKVPIRNKLVQTTYGRVLFNQCLPKELEFVNKTLTKKALSELTREIIETVGIENAPDYLDQIKDIGFRYSTISGISWGIDDLVSPKQKSKIIADAEREVEAVERQFNQGLLTAEEKRARIIEIWSKATQQINHLVKLSFPKDNPVFQITDSGSRGSWEPINQMTGIKGLVQGPQNRIIELPITSSYGEGFDVLEYFTATHGARKGVTDTALKTAQAGYLTRRLVDVAQDLIITEKDCHTTRGIEIFREDGEKFGYSFKDRLFSRTALKDIKVGKKVIVKAGEIIDRKKAELIDQNKKIKSVEVRSPITCNSSEGICSKCYGYDLGNNKPVEVGVAVGIIAAQSIGEPGTQLVLRTFHSGGVAGTDITYGLPRVEEIFEARTPKGKAILAEVDGEVEEIKPQKLFTEIKLKTAEGKIKKYKIPGQNLLLVKEGEKVIKGQQLCEGSIDIKELFELKSEREVVRYIVNEIQKVYTSEGVSINDKHIEIIVRKMLSRILITDPGDTNFVIGDIVERLQFKKENQRVRKLNGKPAKGKQLIKGISKVALTTRSFLSAASFQETASALVKAALSGEKDELKGLKENIIIGHLIPTIGRSKFSESK